MRNAFATLLHTLVTVAVLVTTGCAQAAISSAATATVPSSVGVLNPPAPVAPAGDYESPLEGLSPELMRAFARGEQSFAREFVPEDGLGPIFNNTSCLVCHPGNGRGTPDLALIRFSRRLDLVMSIGGPQFQDKAIPGVPLEFLPVGVDKSTRLPPPVFGLGLVEAIPVETILSYADPDDEDQDGISGRPNWVAAPDFVPVDAVGGGSGRQLGRFGRKASVSSLIQQNANAFHQDIGITSGFIPVENPHPQSGVNWDTVADPEVPASEVIDTVMFIRLLAPPPRGEITPEVVLGERRFVEIGCAVCHVPTMQTGASPIEALNRVPVNLYSDLLLHDMGEELADNRPDVTANGREWRTAPLWGTRLVAEVLGGTPFFLHDGRATTLEAAIRAHGGEAQVAKERFVTLAEADRKAVIAFIESL